MSFAYISFFLNPYQPNVYIGRPFFKLSKIKKIAIYLIRANHSDVNDNTAVPANWETEKNGHLAFLLFPGYKDTAFFTIIFLHKPLWDKLNNQISCSLVLRAANIGSNSILTIFQILQSCHARKRCSHCYIQIYITAWCLNVFLPCTWSTEIRI